MKKYSYRNFGHIPSYSLKTNTLSFMFGVPNLFKRFQAKNIMKEISPQINEVILDFGCGSGYLTVELQRAGAMVSGLDVHQLNTHNALKNCYGINISIVESGIKTPYSNNSFDKIVASEVLPMIPNPEEFLIEMHRILKDDGTLFIINGFGHTRIKKLYDKKGLLYKILKFFFGDRFPLDYKEYTSKINKSFRTAQEDFIDVDDINKKVINSKFSISKTTSIIRERESNYISLFQFIYFLYSGNAVFKISFFYFLYPLIRLLSLISSKKMSKDHLIIKCKKNSC